jgi:hypothetical protein
MNRRPNNGSRSPDPPRHPLPGTVQPKTTAPSRTIQPSTSIPQVRWANHAPKPPAPPVKWGNNGTSTQPKMSPPQLSCPSTQSAHRNRPPAPIPPVRVPDALRSMQPHRPPTIVFPKAARAVRVQAHRATAPTVPAIQPMMTLRARPAPKINPSIESISVAWKKHPGAKEDRGQVQDRDPCRALQRRSIYLSKCAISTASLRLHQDFFRDKRGP